MNANSTGRTHIGRRTNNEDAFIVSPRCGIYIVADGMGGYEGGEIASSVAVSSIQDFFAAHLEDAALTWPFGLDPDLSIMENKVDVAIRLAHKNVLEQRSGRLAEMGATVVVLAVDPYNPEKVVVGHMGDSRVYRLRDGKLHQATRDHSLYNPLPDPRSGHLPTLSRFAHKNIVTRALGFTTSGGDRPEVQSLDTQPGDRWMLCSDGLCDMLDDASILDLLAKEDRDEACEDLVQEAWARGGRDNITVVVVDIAEEERAERAA